MLNKKLLIFYLILADERLFRMLINIFNYMSKSAPAELMANLIKEKNFWLLFKDGTTECDLVKIELREQMSKNSIEIIFSKCSTNYITQNFVRLF